MGLTKLKGSIPDFVYYQLIDIGDKFNINSDLRACHFLAQCEHESNAFKSVVENLNYSADGLLKTFPRYFDKDQAAKYAHNPQMIACLVYGSRMGNGPASCYDGWMYRGRGYIQLTGLNNYKAFTAALKNEKGEGDDCTLNPDLVATKYPLASAAFFFNANKIWPVCDKGWGNDAITSVTKMVNGGTIGLDDRIARFRKFAKIYGN